MELLQYQKHSQYPKIKNKADAFFKKLQAAAHIDDDAKQSKTYAELYESIRPTKLYTDFGGLYCILLEDSCDYFTKTKLKQMQSK